MGIEDYAMLVVLGMLAVVAAVRLFAAPLRLALRLVLRLVLSALLGFAALLALNWTGGFTGVTLGFNLPNALTVGVLGVPGLLLLLLLQWVFV